MKAKIAELAQLIKKPLPPVVTLFGAEEFLKREAIQDLLRSRYGERIPDEDVTWLRGEKNTSPDSLAGLFDDLRTPSLFGGTRTVIVEHAEFYITLDRDAWAALLKSGWAGALLILEFDSLDGRTKVAKGLQKTGWVLEAARPFHRPPPWKPGSPPWENALNQWIRSRAQKQKLRVDAQTAHLLQTRVGTSLAELASTIERIATVLGGKGEITREVVELHTPSGEDSTLFELVDTFFLNDRQRSLNLAKEILHRGNTDTRGARITDPSALLLQFIGATLRRVRQLRMVHEIVAGGGDDNALMSAAGIARPFLPRVKQQAHKSSPARLESIVLALRRADRELKSGSGPLAAELLERITVSC